MQSGLLSALPMKGGLGILVAQKGKHLFVTHAETTDLDTR